MNYFERAFLSVWWDIKKFTNTNIERLEVREKRKQGKYKQ